MFYLRRMDARQYIVTERFIHDDLYNRSAAVVRKLPDMWLRDKKISPVLLCWPESPVKGTDGSTIDDVCVLDLTDIAEAERPDVIKQMARRAKAYGLFFVEQKEGAVHAAFETRQGSFTWTLPIRRHGEVVVLEPAQTVTDGPAVGVLWKRS